LNSLDIFHFLVMSGPCGDGKSGAAICRRPESGKAVVAGFASTESLTNTDGQISLVRSKIWRQKLFCRKYRQWETAS
jgi:hypothetical protein